MRDKKIVPGNNRQSEYGGEPGREDGLATKKSPTGDFFEVA